MIPRTRARHPSRTAPSHSRGEAERGSCEAPYPLTARNRPNAYDVRELLHGWHAGGCEGQANHVSA